MDDGEILYLSHNRYHYYLSSIQGVTDTTQAQIYFRSDGRLYTSSPTYYKLASSAVRAGKRHGYRVNKNGLGMGLLKGANK